MRRIAKMLVVILGAALLAVVGTTFNPRTAHGLVAALVQVSNSPAAPANTLNASRLASQNVQLVCVGTSNCSPTLPDGSSPPTPHIITAGSGSAQMDQANSSGESTRGTWTFAAGGSFQFQYPSGIVLSSGSDVSVNGVTPPFEEAILSGYLVNSQ